VANQDRQGAHAPYFSGDVAEMAPHYYGVEHRFWAPKGAFSRVSREPSGWGEHRDVGLMWGWSLRSTGPVAPGPWPDPSSALRGPTAADAVGVCRLVPARFAAAPFVAVIPRAASRLRQFDLSLPVRLMG